MRELISFCFKGGEEQFIPVTKSGATWINNENELKEKFHIISLKLAINFLTDNFFLIFQQIIGIPMGFDSIPVSILQ